MSDDQRNNETRKIRGKRTRKTAEDWCKYLEEQLQFPFMAEIIDEPAPLEIGDIIKVSGIDGDYDLYGIVVIARKGRKKYWYPLCLLEVVEKESKNYQLVNDYNQWFSNL